MKAGQCDGQTRFRGGLCRSLSTDRRRLGSLPLLYLSGDGNQLRFTWASLSLLHDPLLRHTVL